MKKSDWNSGNIFDGNRNLLSQYHHKLSFDDKIKNEQLNILSEMYSLMKDLRNPISHSGPRPTIKIPNYNDGLDQYNEIIDLINRSYTLFIN